MFAPRFRGSHAIQRRLVRHAIDVNRKTLLPTFHPLNDSSLPNAPPVAPHGPFPNSREIPACRYQLHPNRRQQKVGLRPLIGATVQSEIEYIRARKSKTPSRAAAATVGRGPVPYVVHRVRRPKRRGCSTRSQSVVVYFRSHDHVIIPWTAEIAMNASVSSSGEKEPHLTRIHGRKVKIVAI